MVLTSFVRWSRKIYAVYHNGQLNCTKNSLVDKRNSFTVKPHISELERHFSAKYLERQRDFEWRPCGCLHFLITKGGGQCFPVNAVGLACVCLRIWARKGLPFMCVLHLCSKWLKTHRSSACKRQSCQGLTAASYLRSDVPLHFFLLRFRAFMAGASQPALLRRTLCWGNTRDVRHFCNRATSSRTAHGYAGNLQLGRQLSIF